MDISDRSLRDITGYRLRRATISAMAAFNEIFASFGIRRTTFSALCMIVDNPGLRQGELADALAIERPNLVRIVDELEAEGLARRESAKGDRRAYELHATEKGRRLQEAAMTATLRCDAVIARGLTREQIDVLHAALRKIQENADLWEGANELDISRA